MERNEIIYTVHARTRKIVTLPWSMQKNHFYKLFGEMSRRFKEELGWVFRHCRLYELLIYPLWLLVLL